MQESVYTSIAARETVGGESTAPLVVGAKSPARHSGQNELVNAVKPLYFDKYDAAGNTFVVSETSERHISRQKWGRRAVEACSLRRGVGADGLLVLRSSLKADFQMDVFNTDGSWAERSGNGLRCALAHRLRKEPAKLDWTVQCGREVVTARVSDARPAHLWIEAAVGWPEAVIESKSFVHGGKARYAQLIRIGNPHAVIILPSIPRDWRTLAERVASSGYFTNGVNVEFATRAKNGVSQARVWERGVGETASSGTGAAAIAVALRREKLAESPLAIQFESERLEARWDGEGAPVIVGGPVKFVASGEIML